MGPIWVLWGAYPPWIPLWMSATTWSQHASENHASYNVAAGHVRGFPPNGTILGRAGFGFARFCPDWKGVVLVLHGFAQTGKGWFWFCQVLPILERFTRSWFCKVLPILGGCPGLLLPGFANTCKARQVLVLLSFSRICEYSKVMLSFGFARFCQCWEWVVLVLECLPILRTCARFWLCEVSPILGWCAMLWFYQVLPILGRCAMLWFYQVLPILGRGVMFWFRQVFPWPKRHASFCFVSFCQYSEGKISLFFKFVR